MRKRNRHYAFYPEQLRVKHFIEWVDWMVKLSIYGVPPRLLTEVFDRSIATHWQKKYIKMRIDRWKGYTS